MKERRRTRRAEPAVTPVKDKLKIGFITERMLRGFGVDLVVDRVARGLAQRGHEVTVYASVTDSTLGAEEYKLELIPTPAFAFFPRYELSAQRHLRFLNQQKMDVYLVETFPFFSYLPRLEAPAVAVDHGICSTEGFPVKIRANFRYARLMHSHLYLPFARRIVTVSEYLKREMPRRLQEKTAVIYNGADHYARPLADEAIKLRRTLNVADEDILLLYVGRLNAANQPYKGTAELVDMYRQLRREDNRLRLLMAGFGGPEERAWLESLGVRVITNAAAEQMPVIFSACDIYTTCSRWEGFDLPIVEAQSFGKPVVGLKIGAHPEVVAEGKSGFLPSGIEGMKEVLVRLARNREMRADMGKAALANAERFQWQRAVAQYEQLLQEVA